MLRKEMLRREFLALAPALAMRAHAEPDTKRILVSAAEVEKIRARLGEMQSDAEPLRRAVDKAMKSGPWSVTFARPDVAGLGPNDYFSEGPYWWPDPKNPGGPYIRRDGDRNPDRFNRNHDDLGAMASALLALGMGAALLGEKRCSERANELASVWFVDPKTRMNPNLEHGQAIRGVSAGRGTGIIDTVSLIYAVQGLALLEPDSRVAEGVRKWFADYLEWMRQSTNGREEQKSGNNHSTWWAAQVAAFAYFTGNAAVLDEIWKEYRAYLVPEQIRPDGSCPREESRADSLHYSAYNLDAFAMLCRLAQANGFDLWNFRAAKGGSVLGAIDYLMPYVEQPDKWKKHETNTFKADGHVFPGLAALGTGASKLFDEYFALPRSLNSPWVLWVDLMVRGLRAA